MEKTSNNSNEVSASSGELCSDVCEICGGFGWIRRDREKTDPQLGSLELCPNANPFWIFGGKSGLDKVEYCLSWEKILKVNNIDKTIHVLKGVVEKRSGLVYIHGLYGLGKTLLLQTMVAETIRLHIQSKYSTMANILEELRAAFAEELPYGEYSRRMKDIYEVPVLCIDEFDRLKMTDFAKERIESIIDARCRAAKNGESITIIASNKNPSDYDPYIADRLHYGRFYIIEMKGHSVRPNIPKDESE